MGVLFRLLLISGLDRNMERHRTQSEGSTTGFMFAKYSFYKYLKCHKKLWIGVPEKTFVMRR